MAFILLGSRFDGLLRMILEEWCVSASDSAARRHLLKARSLISSTLNRLDERINLKSLGVPISPSPSSRRRRRVRADVYAIYVEAQAHVDRRPHWKCHSCSIGVVGRESLRFEPAMLPFI